MTKLDSRDITLSTKVHIVQAMVFPVVMYGRESWTIKKVECRRLMLLSCGAGVATLKREEMNRKEQMLSKCGVGGGS